MRYFNFYFIAVLLSMSHYVQGQCNFTVSSATPCGGSVVNFSATGPSGSYTWDFDDDGVIDANGMNASFTYPVLTYPNQINITLYKDGVACHTDDIQTQPSPDPSFGLVPGAAVLEGNNIRTCTSLPNVTLQIFNTSSTYSNNADYTIDWGDGTVENYDNNTFSNTGTISHSYSGFGYYDIVYDVTSTNGCTNSQTFTFYNGANPSVGLATPGNTTGLCAPATIDFPITNININPAGTIYEFYVSGALVATYTQENVPSSFNYTFEESSCGLITSTGNYTNAYDVQIVASNPCGSSQATIEPIEVSEPPEVNMGTGIPGGLCVNEEYTFSNQNTEVGEVVNGNCSGLPASWTITPGVPGVHWVVTSGNMLGSEQLTVEFLIPGEYEIEMIVNSQSCGAVTVTETFSINEGAVATVSVDLETAASPAAEACVPSVATFQNNSTGDSLQYSWNISPATGWNFLDTFNTTSRDLEVQFMVPGQYDISLSLANSCSTETWDTTLNILAPPEVVLSPIKNFCETATLNFDSTLVTYDAHGGTFSTIQWNFPGGNPSFFSGEYPTNIQYNTTGIYNFTVVATNECGDFTASGTFTIQDPNSISVQNDVTVCSSVDPFNLQSNPTGGVWSGVGVSPEGIYTPNDSIIGNNLLTYSFDENNCSLEATMIVTVEPGPPVDAGADQMACIGDPSFIISGGIPSGGTWEIDNGGVIIGDNVFDVTASGIGVYTLTYTFEDSEGCEGSDTKTILVNEPPEANAGLDQSVCLSPFEFNLTGQTPLGGEWSGTGVSATGIFIASNTPGAGEYELYYTYTDPNTLCSDVDTMFMTVTPNVTVNAGEDEIVCILDVAYTLDVGMPLGGTWTGQGIIDPSGIFDPGIAGVGSHVLQYHIGDNECATFDSKLIVVKDLPNINIPIQPTACVNEPNIDLSSTTPEGGIWSGSGISNNEFSPTTAGVGEHILTYSITDSISGCSNSKTFTINIFPLPDVNTTDTSYCHTPGLFDLPMATPFGGEWTGDGVINDRFDPIFAGGVGVYYLTYEFSNQNNCKSSVTITIEVTPAPTVNAGNDIVTCIDGNEIDLLQIASPPNGTWIANGSLGLNGFTFNPAEAGLGEHTLTYSIGENDCVFDDEIIIKVNPLPIVNVGADLEVCVSENAFPLTGVPANGTWTANNGGVLLGNIFNPQASGEGLFSFTYSFTDNNRCTNTDDVVVTVLPLPNLQVNDTTYCLAPGQVDLPIPNEPGGIWSGPGVVNNVFYPQNAGLNNSVVLTYTFINEKGCENTVNSTVTLVSPVVVNAGTDKKVCIDEGTIDISIGISPPNGTWETNGSAGLNGNVFNPSIAGAGQHVITYTVGTGLCQGTDEVVIIVDPLPEVFAGEPESFCLNKNAFVLLGQNPTGGTWSGNGIINPLTGLFDPATAQVGNHILTYHYENPNSGCTNTSTRTVTVLPMEIPNFDIPAKVCIDEDIIFTNNSSPSLDVSWNFGDGGMSNDFTPQHSYSAAGTYDIVLSVENSNGCSETMTKSIEVMGAPTAFFLPDTTDACVGLELHLSNQSLGNNLSYFWDFGNNQTSTLKNPDIVFLEQGVGDTTYIITLTTTNECGSHTYQDLITIHPLPIANIGLSPQSECSPLLMEFANISTGSPTNYFWDFGNGNTSTAPIPAPQTYLAETNTAFYTATLVTTNTCGTDTTSAQIEVTPPNVQALFEPSSTIGCVPMTVDFTNYATATATIDWNFGDGNTSSLPAPTHTFDSAGTYIVTQYAYGYCGYDTESVEIIVLPPPDVSFSNPSQVCKNTEVQFENLSFGTTGNFWDFGDGTTSELNQPTHTYTEPGVYTITLTGVLTNIQCPATYTNTITVLDIPTATFDISGTNGCAPFEVNLTNTSTGTVYYHWDFGDGNTSNEENPSHTYEVAGNYQITMTVTDNNGCYHDVSVTNIIVHPQPVAEFDFERESACGLPALVQFENKSEHANGYLWQFGDGASSTLTNPSFTYEEAGTFNVILTASNQYGCEDTEIRNLTIHEMPEANFELQNTEGCEPLAVTYINNSTTANEFYWDFGDGTTSTDQYPNHIYTEEGLYDVSLIVSVNGECFDTLIFEGAVDVHPTPFANFMVDPNSANANDGYLQFINLSEGGNKYYWEFSDGETSTEANPGHQFLVNGNKQIYLEVTNEYGCTNDTLMSFIPNTIKGLYLPNAFSPQQGIGDVRLFKPVGVGIKEFHLQVFSPYGQLLWETQSLDHGIPTEAWDGTVGGKLLPQDVYVWKCYALFDDGTVWQGMPKKNGGYQRMGSVTLLR